MAWRECGQSGRTVGFRLVGTHKNVPEADLLLIGLSSSAARGIVRHLSIQGLEMGTWEPHLVCLRRRQASRGDRRRTDAGRSPRSSRRAGKPSTRQRGAGDRGRPKPGEHSVYTEQGSIGPILIGQKDALSGLAEFCRGLWRAGYIRKRVRPVRREVTGNRRSRDHTAPVAYSTCNKHVRRHG